VKAKLKVLIAGAGIGGLTAALALLQRGFDVEVFEQAPVLGEVGAGFQIGANGARALFALGLETAIRNVFSEPTGKEVRLWNTGQSWKLFDLGLTSVERYGFPYFMIHRADLHNILVDAVRSLKPDAIHLNARCTGVTQTSQQAHLRFANGATATGDVAIGADGVHSAVRKELFGADNPNFTGFVAWRGIVAADQLSEHLRRSVGVNWIGPGGHVVHYLLRRGELLNFVAAVERSNWLLESWTERGTSEECAADFEGWHEDIHAIIRRLDKPFKWALLSRGPLDSWSVGRITLLGDACHPTLPFLAQGAGMAIEDGYILARCLERFDGEIETALQHYERARIKRANRVVSGSAANAKRFHNTILSNADEAEAYVNDEWQESKVKERYEWLFVYDVTTAAIE
jgi:salicylate hydroxylase